MAVEKGLLFLFLLLVPTQLGKHFWPDWSMVAGIRSDYLSPILYLTDVVWGLWIISKLFSFSVTQLLRKTKRKQIWKGITSLLFVCIMVGINIWMAENRLIAGYRWLRIGQWLISLIVLRLESLKIKQFLKIIMPIWIIGEAGLGLAQVINNGSLQGVFYWLGERKFDYMTIGAATMSWMNEVRVRAYGTFSHPNSMAGFLLVAMLMLMKLEKSGDIKQNTKGFDLPIGEAGKSSPYVYWITIIMGIIGIIISGSRTVWVIGAALLIFNLQFSIFKNEKIRKTLAGVGIVGLLIGGCLVVRNSGGWDIDSFNKRMMLLKAAGMMIMSAPLFGVGAGNFVVKLPEYLKNGIWWLQPVHNIFVLGVSEIGIVGMGMIMWTVTKIPDVSFYASSTDRQMSGKDKNKMILEKLRENWMIVAVIAVTGMVDHYWLTLPQNMWLAAIIAALI